MVAFLLAATAVLWARLPAARRHRRPPDPSTTADLARLLSIAAAAGFPLGTALEAVLPELEGSLATDVDRTLRSSRQVGLTAALLSSVELGALGPSLARAHSSGAPLGPTLAAHLAADAAERVSRALERARTAPVRVMLPLALLLLPGFTALLVGPTLLDHLFEVTRFRG